VRTPEIGRNCLRTKVRLSVCPLGGLLALAASIPRDQHEVVLTDENIETIDFDLKAFSPDKELQWGARLGQRRRLFRYAGASEGGDARVEGGRRQHLDVPETKA
jgi:hypothetical protein